ncbi:hypothetical protein HDU79_002741 [Rhizoclosmatium sp. JEL0117]|nr:hypothetical protein HDU79_002741 [Rhizoclosmatium sp. JEL0117]
MSRPHAPHGSHTPSDAREPTTALYVHLPSDMLNHRYKVLSVLKPRIAKSEVMLAFDNVLDKHVALKIIRKEELTDYERWRVLRETDLLKTLSHPNIIRLENFIETETDFVIVLEYMNDGDLFDLLQQSGKLLPEQVRIIAVQIALALKYLHSRKVIHRDIKPENVGIRQPLASMANIPADITEAIESSSSTTIPLTTEEPSGSVDENEAWTKVKLIDFSLSRYAKDGRARTPCGTLGYMAPEMMLVNLHECEYTSAVDMWAFGCLLYALLTGTPPFEIGKMPESKQDVLVQFPESLWRDIPADAQQCVRACLDPDPGRRVTAARFLGMPWFQEEEGEGEGEGLEHPVPVHAQRAGSIADLLARYDVVEEVGKRGGAGGGGGGGAGVDPDAVYYREPSPPPPGWYLPARLRTPSPGLYERLSRYDEEIARRREAAAKGEVVVGGDKTVAEAVAEMYAGKSFVVKVVAGAGNYDEKVEVPIYHA